jgi:SAM-dependent methyltransferase
MSGENQFGLSSSAASDYEAKSVPAIFGPMAEAMLDAIDLPDTATVLDVACGTGVVARAVGNRLAGSCRIVGADLNPAMIDIARQNHSTGPHNFEWSVAPAERMPFESGSFDLVFCQQGLQFFPDKPAAVHEIRRVMTDRGRLFLTCWAAIPPFFEVVSATLKQHVSVETAATAIRPFIWTDAELIGGIIEAGGFDVPPPQIVPLMRRLPATASAIRTGLLATPNEAALRALGNDVLDRIAAEILDGVENYREGDSLAMPQQTYLFSCTAR